MSELDSIKDENTITLLVLESGAEWPTWGTGLRMKAANSAVEVQAINELTHHFCARVSARLQRIQKSGQRLSSVGYACALDSAGRKSKRRELCTHLLSSLEPNRNSEFILGGGSWENGGEQGVERRGLIALWSELSSQAPACTLSVRFEELPAPGIAQRSVVEELRPKGVVRCSTESLEDRIGKNVARC